MTTWTTHARELAAAPEAAQAATELRSDFLRALAEAATSRSAKDAWCSAVRCIALVGRKTCRARIHIAEPEAGRVEWSCASCGERGTITGCSGTELDLSSYVPRQKKLRVWGFDDKSRDVLLAATTHIPSLRAVIARASPAAEQAQCLVLPLKLADGAVPRLADDHHDPARPRSSAAMSIAIMRASCRRVMAIAP